MFDYRLMPTIKRAHSVYQIAEQTNGFDLITAREHQDKMDGNMRLLSGKPSFLLITLFTLVLSACGSTPLQSTVLLSNHAIDKTSSKIGVYYELPNDIATTHIYGAECFLCASKASALTSALDSHLERTIDEEELEDIKETIFIEFKQRSDDVAYIELSQPMDKLPKFKGGNGFATRDFRFLKEQLEIDYLVVIDFNAHGAAWRFDKDTPLGPPKGYINGVIFTVDLTTNALVQYQEISETVAPKGDWNQPNQFPNVTAAYFQAATNVREIIRKEL